MKNPLSYFLLLDENEINDIIDDRVIEEDDDDDESDEEEGPSRKRKLGIVLPRMLS